MWLGRSSTSPLLRLGRSTTTSLSSDSEESLVAWIHRGVDSVNHARRFATSSVRLGDRYIQFSAAIDVISDHLRTSCVQWTERLSPRFPKA